MNDNDSVANATQEQSREIGDLVRKLQSCEALVVEFQKTLQQRDSKLETLRSQVSLLITQP